MNLLRLWRKPVADPAAIEAARADADDAESRIEQLLPTLFMERERNHFNERIALAFREERR